MSSSTIDGRGPVADLGLSDDLDQPAPHGPAVRRRRTRVALVVLCLLALVAGGGTLLATGARFFVIESPSMGQQAPVGTLVVGLPLQHGEALHLGQVVTYRPPEGTATYTHRIVEIVPGGYRTRGDINGADDPWVVTPTMIVTRAVALVPAAGWLLRLAPIVVCGCIGVWALALLVRAPVRRTSIRVLGYSLVVSLAVYLHHPLVGYLLLTARSADSGLQSTVVSTGFLPIRVQAIGGRAVDLVSGQVGHLTLPRDAHGHAGFSAAPHLDLLGWCALIAVCLIPTLWTMVRGVPTETDDETETETETDEVVIDA